MRTQRGSGVTYQLHGWRLEGPCAEVPSPVQCYGHVGRASPLGPGSRLPAGLLSMEPLLRPSLFLPKSNIKRQSQLTSRSLKVLLTSLVLRFRRTRSSSTSSCTTARAPTRTTTAWTSRTAWTAACRTTSGSTRRRSARWPRSWRAGWGTRVLTNGRAWVRRCSVC